MICATNADNQTLTAPVTILSQETTAKEMRKNLTSTDPIPAERLQNPMQAETLNSAMYEQLNEQQKVAELHARDKEIHELRNRLASAEAELYLQKLAAEK